MSFRSLILIIKPHSIPGSFCNHYFLRMLAMISRGQHVAALDVGKF